MNYKGIIIAGIAAIGLYLFSQQKKTTYKTPHIAPVKKIAKKIPEASTPAARRKIAEEKAAAAAAEKAAEKAAFTPEIKLAISTLSVAEKIQALSAYRKKIAAEKKVSPQSISLTPDMKARVLLEAAIEKAAKTYTAPILLDNSEKKKKKNKTPDDIKEEFGSWDNELEGQETSHKSTELGYSKKEEKTKEDILKLFGLWALPTAPRPILKSKLKPHITAKKRILARIRSPVRRPILKSKLKPYMTAKKRILARIRSPVRRPILKSKLKPYMTAKKRILARIRSPVRRPILKSKLKSHLTPKKRIISKIRPAIRRLIFARRPVRKIRRR